MHTSIHKADIDSSSRMSYLANSKLTNKKVNQAKISNTILADLASRSSNINSLYGSECFIPPLQSPSSNPLTQDQINNLMLKSAALAVLLANILGIKSKTIADMAQLEQEVFNIMNKLASENREFAQAMGTKLEAEAKDAEKKIKEAEEKAAKASFWSSLFGFVVGAIITVCTGGVGAAIGMTMMVSSAVSLGVSAYAMENPDQVFGNSALSSMMQFGIFGVFGSKAAVYIQDIFMIATAGYGLLSSLSSLAAIASEEAAAEGGASIASKIGRGAVSMLNIANTGISLSGSIMSFVDAIKENDKNAALDQALMLGIISAIIEASAGDKVNKNPTLKIIIMIGSMLAMIAAAGADAKLNGTSITSFMDKYPKLQNMSNIFENIQKLMMTMFSISSFDSSLYNYQNTKAQNAISLYEVTSEQVQLQQDQGLNVLKSMNDSSNLLNQDILKQVQSSIQSLQAYFNSASRAIEAQMNVGLNAISVA